MVPTLPHSKAITSLVRIANFMLVATLKQQFLYCIVLFSPIALYYGLHNELIHLFIYHFTAKLIVLSKALYIIAKALETLLLPYLSGHYIFCISIDFMSSILTFYENREQVLIVLLSAAIDFSIITVLSLNAGNIGKGLEVLRFLGVHTTIMSNSSVLYHSVDKVNNDLTLEDINDIILNKEKAYYSHLILCNSISIESNKITKSIGSIEYDVIWVKLTLCKYTRAILLWTINHEVSAKACIEENEIIFASSAHEIRNPLNSLTTILELAIEKLDESNVIKALEHINDAKFSADHALSVARNLLDLSIIKKKTLQLDIKRIEIREIINSIYHTFFHQLKTSNVFLQMHIDDNVPQYIYSDKMKLTQIIFNLISNSSKFTFQGGIIYLLVKANSMKYIQIIVQDTGIGIRKEDISKLGSAFAKIQTHNSINACGVGLGLMISKQLASYLGTGLNFSSQQFKGTKFWFDITTGLNDEESAFFSNIAQISSPQESARTMATQTSSFIPYVSQHSYENVPITHSINFSPSTFVLL